MLPRSGGWPNLCGVGGSGGKSHVVKETIGGRGVGEINGVVWRVQEETGVFIY